jgi:2'-5' RNA ligase
MQSALRQEAASPKSYRLFFALKPDDITARAIDAFAAGQLPDCRRLPIANQHVTMGLTEDFESEPDALTAALIEAGGQGRGEPFDLALTRLSASRSSVALVPHRRIAPLFALQNSLAKAMARHGVAMRQGWTFRPHQTVGYRRGEPHICAIAGFHYRVDHFVLVRSHVGLTRHEVLCRWPLMSTQPMLF